jgi:hypothetical protein
MSSVAESKVQVILAGSNECKSPRLPGQGGWGDKGVGVVGRRTSNNQDFAQFLPRTPRQDIPFVLSYADGVS